MNYRDYFKKLEEDQDYQEAEKELKVILDLADDILRLRIEKGWSQAELAERAGTKQANISRLESGLSNPSISFLQKLAKALDTNLAVSFQKIPTKRIYLATEAANQSQESLMVGNWPAAKVYQSFVHSFITGENMIEHIWSVLCSKSVIDYETNNVSIQDVVEQIVIIGEPVENGFLPLPLELISLWERKETNESLKGSERITLVTPSGKTDVISEAEIDLTKAERHRQRVKFPGLPISEAGKYYFKVEIKNGADDWKQVAAIPLVVMFQ